MDDDFGSENISPSVERNNQKHQSHTKNSDNDIIDLDEIEDFDDDDYNDQICPELFQAKESISSDDEELVCNFFRTFIINAIYHGC